MERVPEILTPSRSTRKYIILVTILFSFGIIVVVTWKGDPNNSLHSDALAWAFTMSMFAIAGYVFDGIFEDYANIKYLKGDS